MVLSLQQGTSRKRSASANARAAAVRQSAGPPGRAAGKRRSMFVLKLPSAAKGCDHVMTASTPNLMASAPGASALVRALETMEEELAIRVIPEERAVMLLQVSKTMRTAMRRVSPPAMIKVRQGQRPESVKNAILNMMKWCRITAIAIDLSDEDIQAKGGDACGGSRTMCITGSSESLLERDRR